ncbi:MAG: stalk domain-containing protein [Tepidibacillus sp.]
MKIKVFMLALFFFMTSSPLFVQAEETQNHYIIINKTTNKLAYFVGTELKKVFPVATGRKAEYTPEGSFKIVQKIKNRPYYKLNIPGGDPKNPLGPRWMGFDARGTNGDTYGIHGNSNPLSIGTYASAGCVRMNNDDVIWLFDQVPIGAKVYIVSSKKGFLQLAGDFGYKVTSSAITLNETLSIDININLDHQPFSLPKNNPSVLKDGHILLPLKPLMGRLGYQLTWDAATNQVHIANQKQDFTIQINKNTILKNDKAIELDIAPTIINGSTYISPKTLGILLESQMNWDEKNLIIDIYTIPTPSIQLDNGTFFALPENYHSYVRNNRLMVPLKPIADQFGYLIQWDSSSNRIGLAHPQKNSTLSIQINQSDLIKNGQLYSLDVAPELQENSTYISLQTLQVWLDLQLEWNQKQNIIQMVVNVEKST